MESDDAFIFDADNHYYEPRDCFTRYMEPKFRDKAVRVIEGENGHDRVMIGDKPFTFLERLFFQKVVKPGRLREMLRNMGDARGGKGDLVETVKPEYLNRDVRLALLDQQGVDACLMFPTLAVCVEEDMRDDADQLYANMHAFNRWLLEDWGFNYKDRIHAPPLLSLLDVDRAVEELEWVLAQDASCIALRPGPAFGRSPADPCFDPFWARVNEAKIPVLFHIAESGYNGMMSVHWGEEPSPPSHRQSAFQWTNFYGDRPIMDTISALIFHNLFGRFPNVKIGSIENGGIWAPYLLRAMDKMGGMGRNGPWIGGRIREKPSQIFRRHVFVTPHHEENIGELVDAIGPSQVLFGSDFPHAEGLAEPRRFVEGLTELPEEQIRMIMGENARRMVFSD